MWFKNLQLFKLSETFNQEALEEKLAERLFVPCKSVDRRTEGFIPPSSKGTLAHIANGFIMFCLQKEEKILPAAAVKQALDIKIAELESQGKKLRKSEKVSLKEDIEHSMVIRAFTKVTKTYAYIDLLEGVLVVNASSHAKAEEFTCFLRETLGSLKIELPKLQDISLLLTNWIKTNTYPSDFIINDSGTLVDEDGGMVRCTRKSFISGDFENLIEDGCMIAELSMNFQEQLSFTLKDDFSIKSLKFLELVVDQAKDMHTETEAERFDADFTIMTESLRQFIKVLLQTFGKSHEN